MIIVRICCSQRDSERIAANLPLSEVKGPKYREFDTVNNNRENLYGAHRSINFDSSPDS